MTPRDRRLVVAMATLLDAVSDPESLEIEALRAELRAALEDWRWEQPNRGYDDGTREHDQAR